VSRRPLLATALAAAVAAAFTLVVVAAPGLHLAYRSPSLHLVIETAGTMIALLAAALILGRFRQTGFAGDLLLAAGLVTLGATNIVFGAVSIVLRETTPGFTAWAPVLARLIGAFLIAAAAFVPERWTLSGRRMLLAVVGPVLVLGLAALAGGALEAQLVLGIDPTISPEASGRPLLVGHPAFLALQAVAAVLLGAAAVGFTRRAARGEDAGLLLWLGPASALSAFARVNYFLFPSIASEWVYTGDVLRLGFYLLLVAGEAAELRLYWRRETVAAAREERRRLARDLHDGLAQELAFIVREASGELPRAQLAAAAQRALEESRRAIVALSGSPDDPLEVVLRQTGDDAARRAGGSVSYDLEPGPDVGPERREALVRIMREAIVNALLHGAAGRVRVTLERADGLHLVVADDGSGFDPDAVGSGYGLASMRERAEAAGGRLAVVSRPGLGTRVEVALP
jgi:signal transduction histidine kinase